MITDNKAQDQFIEDYLDGNIPMGLGIDCDDLDHHIRYKQGQFVIVNGLDNVGKTAWMLWYFLALAVKHGKKFCVYSAENNPSVLVMHLIEMYLTQKITEVSKEKMYAAKAFIYEHFKFIDYKGFYKIDELLEIFKKSGCDAGLIDPYTALNREYTHSANYDFLNYTRSFVNKNNFTIYVNTHVVSEAARAVHTANEGGHITSQGLIGYQKPPSKSQSEGGQPFANRVDDFITIHRYVGHNELKYKTMVFVRKVKDTHTGGQPTSIDNPIWFDWNYGCGFTCNGVNPINKKDTNYNTAPF